MRRILWLMVMSLAGLGMLTACGSDDSGQTEVPTTTEAESGGDTSTPTTAAPAADVDDADDTLMAWMDAVSKGQDGKLYDYLHPDHQALISRETFLLCWGNDAPNITIDNVRVIETYEEETPIPRVDGLHQSLAVTAEFVGSMRSMEIEETETFHLFDVDGQWKLVLTEDAMSRMDPCLTDS